MECNNRKPCGEWIENAVSEQIDNNADRELLRDLLKNKERGKSERLHKTMYRESKFLEEMVVRYNILHFTLYFLDKNNEYIFNYTYIS